MNTVNQYRYVCIELGNIKPEISCQQMYHFFSTEKLRLMPTFEITGTLTYTFLPAVQTKLEKRVEQTNI